MEINEILESIITGNSTLFTGSGFSYGTTNILGKSPITAVPLTEKLYKDAGIDENDNDLKNASHFYIDTFSEYDLIKLLRENYTITKVTDSHLTIADLPWKRIYTTNYDNALELASHQNNKLLTPIILSERIDQYKDKRTLCVHLNGYIDRLTPNSLYKDFKLTDASYLTTDFLISSWIDLFRSDIETSKVVLFIGFSLISDLDLSRIISTHSKRDNLVFIVKPNESQLLIKRLKKYGTVFDLGIDGLAEAIKQKQLTFEKPDDKEMILQSFTLSNVSGNSPKLKDKDIFDLLFKGDSNTDLIHYSLVNPDQYRYYIKREQIEDVVDYIKKGGKNILIHSDLGNGKTLFLEGLMDQLKNLDYRVYKFNKYYDTTFDEIEYLCTKVHRCILIIEKYSDHFDLLRKIALFRTSDITIIVSDRSIINDTVYLTLEKVIFEESYLIKDLNKLSLIEVTNLMQMISHYGLWGNYSSQKDDVKRKIITDDCKSSFRLFLLHLLASPDIKERFNKLLRFIKDANESFFDATLLILASNVFEFHLDLNKLIYILDDELINNPSFYSNDQLKEVLNFHESKIYVRSSILAQSLLSQPQFHHSLIILLIKVFRKLDNRTFDKNNYQILKSLVSFSRLQSIFNLKENSHFKAVVLNFYEEIKDTKFASKNPFFWLQYAIARLSSRDYPIADKYFQTAYSFARANDEFDTFHIDNHFARHILENEIYNGSDDTAMEQFIKAHNMLSVKTSVNENRHYPIRVATNYGRFYDRYYKNFSLQNKKVFIISCREIMLKIIEYKTSVDYERWNKSVMVCESELNRILDKEGDFKI
ncbi:SIR2-like protein [Mucilaginibacter yixingensis]|uniref:SIR2-like protein n=1 Tax=Mucilaginibacter yixingensis TaxID=1295612 RepID=A0A2T5JBM5_9SPHI|nr:SIR2 family protein [Mucilaginibacter yixingensis]PTQ98277.1 SIR2-like protein [Mucilaginibacter yixingensis]